MRRAYLKGHAADVQYVGADDLSDPENPYRGPRARVRFDDGWLHICTDDYEGHAMLNIEALPRLRQALARIAHELKKRALASNEKTA